MSTHIFAVVQVWRDTHWDTVPQAWPPSGTPADRAWAVLLTCKYPVFAVLAGVRNGRGFAGVYTHDPLRPIAAPRGLPEDFPDPDLPSMGMYGLSWVTLAELLAYDWEQPLTEGGALPADEYDAWHASGAPVPARWFRRVGGPDVITVPEAEYWELRDEYRRHAARTNTPLYIEGVRWQRPLREVIAPWVDVVLPWLRSLGPPDEVRLVFGFG